MLFLMKLTLMMMPIMQCLELGHHSIWKSWALHIKELLSFSPCVLWKIQETVLQQHKFWMFWSQKSSYISQPKFTPAPYGSFCSLLEKFLGANIVILPENVQYLVSS
uniref:Uncharacterized protein n=1 Tax=Micrurus corallinus TaxID=54390 RepID=A0A2D4G890_MICCO